MRMLCDVERKIVALISDDVVRTIINAVIIGSSELVSESIVVYTGSLTVAESLRAVLHAVQRQTYNCKTR